MSKKSSAVSSSLVSALALSLMACGAEQPAPTQQSQSTSEDVRCVQTNDQNQEVVVDDSVCQPRADGSSAGHWYYGGVGGFILGSVLNGGRTGPPPAGGRSTTVDSGTSVSRGGAGSTAGSSSSSSSGNAGSVGG